MPAENIIRTDCPSDNRETVDPSSPRRRRRSDYDYASHGRIRSEELVDWMHINNLVNRTDTWGAYLPLSERSEHNKAKDEYGVLTWDEVERHFVGADVSDIIGLHAISSENTCTWLAVDIDHHGEPDEELAELNLRAAKAWFNRLRKMGFEPLLIDSNGHGGFHLMFLFDQNVESKVVFNFGGWLVADWQEHGLRERPELFPCHPRLDEKTPFGNWLRLPGRHHTLEFVSRVWADQEIHG